MGDSKTSKLDWGMSEQNIAKWLRDEGESRPFHDSGTYGAKLIEAGGEIDRLAALNAEMLEALVPFVDQAHLHIADAPEWDDDSVVRAIIRIGDLRRTLNVHDKAAFEGTEQ